MSNYFRHIKAVLEGRLAESRPLIQVVVGPRQVGKTTAIKQALAGNGVYESADSPTPLAPEIIEQWWAQAKINKSKILAIDEVQKIRGWSEVIKKLWDKDKTLKVILSGSAALSIEKDLRESMAGRFELIRAEHWNYQEAKLIFKKSIIDFIEFGCYPGSEIFIHDLERWSAYIRDSIIEPAIGRDLLQLHPIQNPSLLRQLFGFAVANPAQIISLQKLQGQVQDKGAIATIQHYLELLTSAFLITGVQKFSTNSLRVRQSSPKIIVHDNALLRAFERGAPDSKRLGRYFENVIGARFIEAGWQTFYWNDRDQEVDFVVLGPKGEKWAIEVKSAGATKKDFRALTSFVKKHPDFEAKAITLAPCDLPVGVGSLNVEEILSLSR